MVDVSLVVMPYAALEHPSIAVGTLTACLKRAGISARGHYANIRFAERIGLETYCFLSRSSITDLLGEWTFAGAAFPGHEPDQSEYFRTIGQGYSSFCKASPIGVDQSRWESLRGEAAAFVDQAAHEILTDDPAIIGCSSVFQQHCASLALLRRVRELAPSVVTIMGGANCEGVMGRSTHHHFDWVDYLVSGEADSILPELCVQILGGGRSVELHNLPQAVLGPGHRGQRAPDLDRAMVHDLDGLPDPEYEDYFQQVAASGFSRNLRPGLVVETSRGCLWGQKHQCTFCGLNGGGLLHRKKSPSRVVAELGTLSVRYQNRRVQVVDNALNVTWLRGALRELGEEPSKLSIMCETITNLSKKDLQLLADAGVVFVQAGIENLHDELLKLMRKPNRVFNSLAFLKASLELGIYVIWNVLSGVPGESVEWYDEMAEWLPLVSHLQPPTGVSPIRFDRFSPFHECRDDFGLRLEPYLAYGHVYPLDGADLQDLAYFFEDRSQEAADRGSGQGSQRFTQALRRWRQGFYVEGSGSTAPDARPRRPRLEMRVDEGVLVIRDTRPCAVAEEFRIEESLRRAVVEGCEVARTAESLRVHLQKNGVSARSVEEIESEVDRLVADKLMLRIGDRFMSLAVGESRALPLVIENPGGNVWMRREKVD